MAELNAFQIELDRRLRRKIRALEPGSQELKRFLMKIGIRLEAEAKQNARNKGVVDTGQLINSIRYELFHTNTGSGVKLGTPGIQYGGLHEFGVPPVAVPGIRSAGGSAPNLNEMRKAMFARLREEGKLGLRTGKGIFTSGSFQGRPYLRPAIVKLKKTIRKQLFEFIRSL